jgi:hypothetical protein
MADAQVPTTLNPQGGAGALVLHSLDEYMRFGALCIESGLALGHKNPASVVIAVQFGAELGLSPMASLRNVHVFAGKPLPSADLLVAVALAHPACLYFRKIEESAVTATWETHRRGNPAPTRYSFTVDDAKRAGLVGKDNWKNYTQRMLSARAKAFLARDVYPDRLAGILTVEEAQDIEAPPENAGPVITIERASASDPAAHEKTISEPEARHLDQRRRLGEHDGEKFLRSLTHRFGVSRLGEIKRRDYETILARADDKTPLGDLPEDFETPVSGEGASPETSAA